MNKTSSNRLKSTLFGLSLLSLFLTQSDAAPTIYILGDSTVSTYASSSSRRGWGQKLQYHISTSKGVVSNKAVGGTSSKSFYNNYWTSIKNSLKSGDYVFIGFGINDSADDEARHTVASTTFKDYLRKYSSETKAKGAYPVIVSTMCRNSWKSDGVTVYPAYHGYPVASREVAGELGIPLIDLDKMSVAHLQSKGKTYATNTIYTDGVHLKNQGAIEMAKLVANGSHGISKSSYSSLKKLLPLANP